MVAEAAALGVPTIATDCVAGPREILADGQYGDLVETDSAAALSEAIVNHFQKPKRLLAKSRASMAQIERLSLKTCGQKIQQANSSLYSGRDVTAYVPTALNVAF